MRLRISLLFFLVYLPVAQALAQTASITGSVRSSGKGLPAATVSLLNAGDSSWVKSVLTDDTGTFVIANVKSGTYIVSATSVGFAAALKAIDIKDTSEYRCDIELQKDSTNLDDVTVTGKKPFMEMSLGKIVVNVDGSPASTGSNVLELLRRLPGVTVAPDGTINMLGKQGVLVLIDDRPTYLSADQLADYLKSLPSDNVAKLELITQPSAKYDAAGNTGIINVKTKKNSANGFNGSLSYTYGQGIYPFGEGSLLLNYKKNKLNLYLDCSSLNAVGFATWDENEYVMKPYTDTIAQYMHIHSHPVEHFGNASVRIGADYDAGKDTKIGANVNGSYHPNYNHYNIENNTVDYTTKDTSSSLAASRDGFIRKNVFANCYLDHKMKGENDFVINVDYLDYSDRATQTIYNTTYNSLFQPQPNPLVLSSLQPATIKVYSFKADYTAALSGGTKLEAGVKSSITITDNDAEFNTFQNGQWMTDTTRSNHFIYRENINAAYASFNKSIGDKWELRGGLRAENTNAQGIQTVHDQDFYRSYLSLFPTAYITYKKDKNNQFEINYGRRVNRPSYRSLNPFLYYSFENYFWSGNPNLQPEYTNNVEVKHSYKNMVITTVTLSNTTNVITDMIRFDDSSRLLYSTPENFRQNKSVTYSMVFNKEFFKWWTQTISGHVYYAVYNGSDGYMPITKAGTGYAASTNSLFDLRKGWKGEAIVYYEGKSVWSATSSGDATIFMICSISKKAGDHITIKAGANDPFNLYQSVIHNYVYNFHATASFRYASMQYNVSATWSFGKNKVKRHETATPEETNRMKMN